MGDDASAGGVEPPTVQRTRVFISYSRKDTAFVDRLAASMLARGCDVLLDREDISGGEAWKERLDALILQADAVVFVVSPDSVASPICAWETERTVELGKRLVPLCCRRIDDASAPAQLARLNYIFVDAEDQYEDGVARAAAACDVDIAWVREHTRLVDLATRWDGDGRKDAALLRGEPLASAEAWLARRTPLAPSVPETLNAFLQAARSAETAALERERKALKRTKQLQRGVSVLIGVAAVVVLIAGVGAATLIRNLSAQRSASLAELARAASDEQMYDRAARYARAGLTGADWPIIGYDAAAAETQLRRAAAASRAQGILRGPRDHVALRAVAISRDGARIATGNTMGLVEVWDARTRRVLFDERVAGEVLRLEFSADGQSLLVGSAGNIVSVIDNTEQSLRFDVTDASPFAAFSPDGASVVLVQGNIARALSIADGRELLQFSGSDRRLEDVAYSADGRRIVTSADEEVRVWDASSGSPLRTISTPRMLPMNASLSADGAFVGVIYADNVGAACFDAATGRLIAERGDGVQVAFSADGRFVAIVLRTGNADVFELATGQQSSPIPWRRGGNPRFRGTHIVSLWQEDDSAWIWGPPRSIGVRGHEGNIVGSALSSDASRLVTASEDGDARVWDSSGRRPEVARMAASVAAVSSDETAYASINGRDGVLRVLEFAGDREVVAIHAWPTGDEYAAQRGVTALSAHGERVAAARQGEPARVWSTDTGALAWTATSCEGLRALAFSPDGRRLAGACGYHVRIWDAATGRELLAVMPGGIVSALAFSADGERFATDGDIWDAASGRRLSTFLHDTYQIERVAFSPDGTLFVTGASNGAVRVWDQSRPVATLNDHTGQITLLRFSDDGQRLLTADSHGVARLWSTTTFTELAVMEGVSGSNAMWLADGAGVEIFSGSARYDWRFAPALTADRRALLDMACETTLAGDLALFTARERAQAPVLDGRFDGNACETPTIWSRLASYFIPQ